MNALETNQSPNHYEVLGADPLATLDQIEDLFRQLAVNAETSGDHSSVPQAIEAFKVLRDPGTRQQYDQQLGLAPVEQSVIAEPSEAIEESAVEEPEVEPVPVEPAADEQVSTLVDESQQETEAPALDVQLSFEEELKLSPDVLAAQRRELLRMFYEKKRKNMRASGIAIGGLDSIVPYSYELLEFNLWVLAEKKWVVREESGALSISAAGCESHEQNLTDGLIQPGQ